MLPCIITVVQNPCTMYQIFGITHHVPKFCNIMATGTVDWELIYVYCLPQPCHNPPKASLDAAKAHPRPMLPGAIAQPFFRCFENNACRSTYIWDLCWHGRVRKHSRVYVLARAIMKKWNKRCPVEGRGAKFVDLSIVLERFCNMPDLSDLLPEAVMACAMYHIVCTMYHVPCVL